MSQQSQSQKLTTEIETASEELLVDMNDWPEYKRNVKGLIFLNEFDGQISENATPIEIPEVVKEPNIAPQYQCIKCGKIHSNNNNNSNQQEEELHRMKCSRCYNKAFNKIRPTKWVKFTAN